MLNRQKVLDWAQKRSEKRSIGERAWQDLVDLPAREVWRLLPGADWLRERFCGPRIHLCTICNARSGGCTEDCGFCAQSRVALEPVPVYPLLSGPQITAYAQKALCPEINRFSLVTSGRGLGLAEVQRLAAELDGLRQMGVELCASLGIIEDRALKALARAGVSRYHHNLETAPSHFSKVCSSHSFVQRQETLQRARANGLSLCSGGIFGLGESDAQVLELGLELDRLNVQAVPVNFYVPIKGTPLAKEHNLSPLRCLKILALLRLLLPDTEIIVCGGREYNLGPLHPFIFQAGASALMTGNYLTTSGRSAGQDLDLLTDLGLGLRPGP